MTKIDIFCEASKINNPEILHIKRGLSNKIPQYCKINGACNKFITMGANGNIYKTCTNQNQQTFICNIQDNKCWTNVNNWLNKKI